MSLSRRFLPQHRGRTGPEAKIKDAIIKMLMTKGWFVKETHGNMYQSGFADLFACHSRYGQRWIEIKLPEGKGSKFTPAQMEDFPKFGAHGSGIWILTGATETEYEKLFRPPNWYQYLNVWKTI